jgi:hypothetical protein
LPPSTPSVWATTGAASPVSSGCDGPAAQRVATYRNAEVCASLAAARAKVAVPGRVDLD